MKRKETNRLHPPCFDVHVHTERAVKHLEAQTDLSMWARLSRTLQCLVV